MLMQLEFHLPVVMERVAMAVQSGLDVHPALRLAHRIATETSETQGAADPVSVLLDEACNLAEAGRTLKEALLEIGGRSPSSSIRHAFMHLALACEEGGELSLPLQELSDATQRRYQETVEEMIAKLPVKATAPLVCTFAGLLLTFITPPVLRVAGLSKKIPPPPPPITIEHKEGR
jgi:Flp pilus assembly protein TadB